MNNYEKHAWQEFRAAGWVDDNNKFQDEIVCADTEHARFIEGEMQELGLRKPLFNLQIPDRYAYRDPELVRLIKERYDAALKEHDDE